MHNDVRIVEFSPKDIIGFVPANKEQFDFLLRIPRFFLELQSWCEGNALSVWRGDTVLAVVYWVNSMFTQNATMAFIPSVELKKKFNKNVLRAFREILYFVKSRHVRIEADCEDNPIFKRFLEFLGFEEEGIVRRGSYKYDDVHLYSIINDDLRKTLVRTDE